MKQIIRIKINGGSDVIVNPGVLIEDAQKMIRDLYQCTNIKKIVMVIEKVKEK